MVRLSHRPLGVFCGGFEAGRSGGVEGTTRNHASFSVNFDGDSNPRGLQYHYRVPPTVVPRVGDHESPESSHQPTSSSFRVPSQSSRGRTLRTCPSCTSSTVSGHTSRPTRIRLQYPGGRWRDGAQGLFYWRWGYTGVDVCPLRLGVSGLLGVHEDLLPEVEPLRRRDAPRLPTTSARVPRGG